MSFIGILDNVGAVDLTVVDLLPPGIASAKSGRSSWMGLVVPAYDSILGFGEFMYASVSPSTTIVAAAICEFQYLLDSSNQPVVKAVPWAGTASTPKVLGLMYPGVTSNTLTQYCWFQVGGLGVVNTSGAMTPNSAFSWGASGVILNGTVATKTVLNGEVCTDQNAQIGTNTGPYSPFSQNGFKFNGQCLVHINRPTSSAA